MSEKYEVLITEDNEATALNLRKALELRGHRVTHSNTCRAAKAIVEQRKFDIAFVDLDLEKEKAGFELLPILTYRGTYPVIISGHDEDDYIEQGYNVACGDYIVKPFTKEKLDRIFDKVKNLGAVNRFRQIIGKEFLTIDPETIAQLKKVEENINSNNSFYITGPTGTGKTILGQAIHRSKNDDQHKYIHVNCAAIPTDLIESEVFGTKKGAFTGAIEKQGKLVEADGGTLHLDEIGSMPMKLQEKLLLALDDGFVTPVGGNNRDKIKTSFQLISSTCESLEEKVAKGEFREDLFYRLMEVHIHLKALRDRQGDTPFLVNKMIEELKRERGFVVKAKAKEALLKYNWYGNVREMVKFFKSKSEMLRPILLYEDLPDYIIHNFNRFVNTKTQFITEEQLKLIEDISYPLFEFKQETEIVRYFYKKCSFNKAKTRTALGNMTQYTFDKHMKIIEAEHETGK